MGIEYRSYNLGDEITPLIKTMSQEAINDFEGSAGVKHPTQFTDTEFAQERLGTAGTIASGRMSVTFCLELMRRNFGADSFGKYSGRSSFTQVLDEVVKAADLNEQQLARLIKSFHENDLLD